MNRQPIDSSNLRSVGYDPEGQVLELEFNNGSLYQYLSVPESVHTGLVAASSAGRYFNENIKNVFRYTQIR